MRQPERNEAERSSSHNLSLNVREHQKFYEEESYRGKGNRSQENKKKGSFKCSKEMQPLGRDREQHIKHVNSKFQDWTSPGNRTTRSPLGESLFTSCLLNQ